MKYRDIMNQDIDNFFKAKWPARVLLPLASLHRQIMTARDDYIRARNEILARHTVCDDDGRPVIDENGNATILEGHMAQLMSEMAVLDGQEVNIQLGPIHLSHGDVPDGLSPAIVSLLLDWIDYGD